MEKQQINFAAKRAAIYWVYPDMGLSSPCWLESSSVTQDDRVAFDYPAGSDYPGGTVSLCRGEDGMFSGVSNHGARFTAVRANHRTGVVLTGNFDDEYGLHGCFVLVLPKPIELTEENRK